MGKAGLSELQEDGSVPRRVSYLVRVNKTLSGWTRDVYCRYKLHTYKHDEKQNPEHERKVLLTRPVWTLVTTAAGVLCLLR